MNIKVCAALVLGISVGYGVSVTEDHMRQADESLIKTVDMLTKQLEQQEALTRKLLAKIESQKLASSNELHETVVQEVVVEDSPDNAYAVTSASAVESAREFLSSGDIFKAMSEFNKALNLATTADERSAAIDGLVDVYRATHDGILASGENIHGALWQLFEIHKIRPSSHLSQEMSDLSMRIYGELETLRINNDVLAQSDYLASLFFTSSMAGTQVIGSDGKQVTSAALKEEMDAVQSTSQFLEELESRAEANLNGDPIAQSLVFWDYAKIAELKGQAVWDSDVFVQSFSQATMQHLDSLKAMNQTGEIKSRMDYIRFSFPKLMENPSIQGFH